MPLRGGGASQRGGTCRRHSASPQIMVICGMSIMRITIVNPKAEKWLKDLEELNLIAIEDTSVNIVTNALKKFFSKKDTTPASTPTPSLEEIIKDVDIVRRERREKKEFHFKN